MQRWLRSTTRGTIYASDGAVPTERGWFEAAERFVAHVKSVAPMPRLQVPTMATYDLTVNDKTYRCSVRESPIAPGSAAYVEYAQPSTAPEYFEAAAPPERHGPRPTPCSCMQAASSASIY